MNTTTKTLAALSAFTLMAGSVGAATITILNHSFESQVTTNFGGLIDDWSVGDDGNGGGSQVATFLQSGATFSSRIAPLPDGSNQGIFSRGGDPYQVLSTNVAANTTYTLTVDLGDRTDLGFAGGELRLGIGNTFGTNLLTATVVSNDTPANGQWSTWVSTFTTGASPSAGALRVELLNTGADQTLFDNVRLDAAPVPEPGSLALLGLGGLQIGARRRRG